MTRDGREPLVSFVVPCYNYGRYLRDCLNSIFNQEGGHDFEVIAIDDASSDDTQEILRAYDDPRLRVISHPVNRGHAETISHGLQLARGHFVARIDPDDRYRPYFLSSVVDKLVSFPELGLAYGDAAVIDEHGSITVEQSDTVHESTDYQGNEFIKLLERNFICAPTVIARREAWLEALPVPKGLAFNDWYFTLMIARRYDFYYMPRVIAEYRVHSSNHHTRIAKEKSEEASIFSLLNRIFSEKEIRPDLDAAKGRAKRRIYGAHYLDQATKYFGFRMDADSRRCYFRALRYRPEYLMKPATIRRLFGTLVGRDRYDAYKAKLKPVR
jgi:glycosyltransferase involved in cell wall biosynthesis